MSKHVVVQGPVEHDGTIYEEGQELSVLTDEQAAPLLLLGVLELLAKPGKPAADVH
jgi:hypothetical protein